MQMSPYLAFDGNCQEAFKFYEKCLNGKIEAMIPHEGSPIAKDVPAEWQKKIMHARLSFDGQVLMGGDAPPNHYKKPQGFSVNLTIQQSKDAERIFNALGENGSIQMPIQETFWAHRFGMLIDRFGIPWMVNCEKTSYAGVQSS